MRTTTLVYDFEEPFRWLVDITVLRLIESRAFTQDDFYFTAEDYRLRIKPPLLDRYAGLVRQHFNSGVIYSGGDRLQWDTVILRKCQEFARYLTGNMGTFNADSPVAAFERSDSQILRETILSLSAREARKVGLSKSTVHYLKRHARDSRPFNIYRPSRDKLKKMAMRVKGS